MFRVSPTKPKPKIKPLRVGFSNSIWQSTKNLVVDSNWDEDTRLGNVPDVPFSSHIDTFYKDLDIMKASGQNSYRFSIEWCELEPESGQFNPLAIMRYRKMLEACHQREMEPMITLLHFVEPLWFTKLGGFEKEENIFYFVRYSKKVFEEFSSLVTLIGTINEPAVQAFSGWLYGQFPPHKHSWKLAVKVLSNLLKAHVAVYQEIKGMPGGAYSEIGLVHNFLKFIPRYDTVILNELTKTISILTNDIVMRFLSSGCIDQIDYYDPLAIDSYDWSGLNFYANPIIGPTGPTCFAGDIMGDMYLRIDPKGFEDAIRQFAALNKPIYITETGIAANNDDCIRKEFLVQFLEVFERLVKEGIDLRAFYYWSFVKNREWNEGDTRDFGLFKPNREKRLSTLFYETFMRKHQAPAITDEPENFQSCRLS